MVTQLNPIFERLIKGEVKYQSANLGFNLLISRLQKKFSNLQTGDVLESCLAEMHAFCEKYQKIVAKDVELLKKL